MQGDSPRMLDTQTAQSDTLKALDSPSLWRDDDAEVEESQKSLGTPSDIAHSDC